MDEAQVHVKGGDGGAGAVSFRREAHVPRGGPDGGDGGRGGDVWLVASTNVASLLAFKDHPHRRAANARHGAGARRHGASGEDLEVPVPPGTTVRDLEGTTLADLAEPGDRWLAARGGRGGRGNARFLTNRRRAPAFAEQGEPGEERWLDLELRLMADVAIVGFPNAGKSTLISRISAAKPKIADYPFTTLEPHLGVVRFGAAGSDVEMVVADIPGLVENAAEGRGLGHRFLRHVERARVLLVLIDLGTIDPVSGQALYGPSPQHQERVLLDELRRYRPELLDRPRLVVGSKLDAVAKEPVSSGRPYGCFGGGREMDISAVAGWGIDQLLKRLAALVTKARQSQDIGTPSVIHRPLPEGVEVSRAADGSWVVGGRALARALALSDLTDPDAMDYVQSRMRRLGVERALVRAGVRDGDTVHAGQLTFEYQRDELSAPSEQDDGPKRRSKR